MFLCSSIGLGLGIISDDFDFDRPKYVKISKMSASRGIKSSNNKCSLYLPKKYFKTPKRFVYL